MIFEERKEQFRSIPNNFFGYPTALVYKKLPSSRVNNMLESASADLDQFLHFSPGPWVLP